MINRLPVWFRQDIPDRAVLDTCSLISGYKLNTVCQHAHCPNLSRCLKDKEVTFMLLGKQCTRNCGFCAVEKNKVPFGIDLDEPYRISEAVRELGLKYIVLTSVCRDDLLDGGAGIFVKAVSLIRNISSDIKIEVLIPDFKGNTDSLRALINAGVNVLAHNIETIEQLYARLRPQASYKLSLQILHKAKELSSHIITKSSIMLGLGEKEEEVFKSMQDLRDKQCDILTLGQYLAPSLNHYPVKEFISPKKFELYRLLALNLGFKAVLSGPLVRSSYQAGRLYSEII